MLCGVPRRSWTRRTTPCEGVGRLLRLSDRSGGRQEHEHCRGCGSCCSGRRPRRPRRWLVQGNMASSAPTEPPAAVPRGRRCPRTIRRSPTRGTAATGPTPTPAPRRSKCRTSRFSRAIPARSATRHGLRDGPAWGAGAARRPSAGGGQGLPSPEAALQSLRRAVHGAATGGRGHGEVRRHGREHDRAF